MTAHRGLFVDYDSVNDVGTSPTEARHALSALIETNGSSGLDVRLGVFADTNLTAVVSGTAATTPMTYSIRSFKAVTSLSTANGPTIVYNDATTTVETTNAPGSNSRIDVIWVRQHLLASDGGVDSDNEPEFGVTQGTAAASPSVPAIPTGALALYYATVPTGVTATNSGVTFVRAHNWTVARGGAIPVADNTERDTITAPREGQQIWHMGDNALYVYDGAGWKKPSDLLTWTAYTPTLTAASVNPTFGTGGAITGFYQVVGKVLHWRVKVYWGTTAGTAGTGIYRVSMPSTAPDAGYYAQGANLGTFNVSISGSSGAIGSNWYGYVVQGSTGAFEGWWNSAQWGSATVGGQANATFWLSGSYAIA